MIKTTVVIITVATSAAFLIGFLAGWKTTLAVIDSVDRRSRS